MSLSQPLFNLVWSLALGLLLCSCRSQPTPPEPLNLLLVTLDTTRRDAIAPYAPESASPHLAEFARHATVFDDAYSAANVTNPSHTSILTGLPALEHGLFDNYESLAPTIDTLPKALQRAGYTTAFVPAIAHLWRAFEGRGFDLTVTTPDRRTAAAVVDRAVRWLDERPQNRPFFLWTHFFDAHSPYLPDPTTTPPVTVAPYLAGAAPLSTLPFFSERNTPMAAWLEDWSNPSYPEALYAAAVHSIDAHLGRLLGELEARGLRESTVVVVTADHGESHTEHGIYFAHTGLYQPTIAVPMLIAIPGRTHGARRSERVSHLDLAPTICELLGVEIKNSLSGRSLMPLVDGADSSSWGPRTVIVESARNTQVAAFYGAYKLIVAIAERRPLAATNELFDLERDPGESASLEGDQEVLRILGPPTQPWRELGKVTTRNTVDEATRKQLEALGYAR